MSGSFGTDRLGLHLRAPAAALLVLVAGFVALLAGPSRADAGVRGIDVSRFQGTIDWAQVGETQIRFAYLQASRGMGRDCSVAPDDCGPDPTYAFNYENARANGIAVGAYHRAFAAGSTRKRAKKDALREVRVFVDTVKGVSKLRKYDMIPVLDLESPFTRLNPDRLIFWTKTWLRHVERKLGVKPMIYTNMSSWSETGDTLRFAKRGFPLWVANFDVEVPLVPAQNWAGFGYSMWQFTSTGSVRGISGDVDKNKLRVPLQDIQKVGAKAAQRRLSR